MKKQLVTACKRNSPAAGATQGYERLHANRYRQPYHDIATSKRVTGNEQTSHRFGKIKRGATPPTRQHTVAPHLLLPRHTNDTNFDYI